MWRCGLRLQRYNFPYFWFLLWCMCVHVEVRRQLGGIASLFPPLYRYWGSNACWWIWYQIPLPAETSHQPQTHFMEISHTDILLQYFQHTLHTENGEHITILIKLNHPCWSYRKNASTKHEFLQPTCTQYTLWVQGSPEATKVGADASQALTTEGMSRHLHRKCGLTWLRHKRLLCEAGGQSSMGPMEESNWVMGQGYWPSHTEEMTLGQCQEAFKELNGRHAVP